MAVVCHNYYAYSTCYHKDSNCKEEPLGIVIEIATIIFLVSLTDFLPSKHYTLSFSHRHPSAVRSDSVRRPIGLRPPSDRIAFGVR